DLERVLPLHAHVDHQMVLFDYSSHSNKYRDMEIFSLHWAYHVVNAQTYLWVTDYMSYRLRHFGNDSHRSLQIQPLRMLLHQSPFYRYSNIQDFAQAQYAHSQPNL